MWSVGDQGLFAASNFIANVLLARLTPAHDYGAFVVAFSALQVIGQLHVGLLIDPMQVFGAGRYAPRFPGYVRTLLRAHWQYTALGAALFAAAALVARAAGDPVLAGAFAGVAVGGPFLSLSWLLRGACTARLRPDLAAAAGAGNLVLVLGGLYLLHGLRVLSPLSALVTIGGASLVSAAWLVARLGVLSAAPFDAAERAAVLTEHRRYGRWTAGAGVLNWVPAEVFYLVLPFWGGLRETAAVKALANLILPALQVQYVLTNVLTPSLVNVRGRPAFARIIRTAAVVAVVAYCVHWVALGLLGKPLLALLYAGRFTERAGLLWVFGAVPLVAGVGAVLTSALRALERPREIFRAAVVSAGVALAGTTLVATAGATGVAAARLAGALVFVAVLWSGLARSRRLAVLDAPLAASLTAPLEAPLEARTRA